MVTAQREELKLLIAVDFGKSSAAQVLVLSHFYPPGWLKDKKEPRFRACVGLLSRG